MICIKEDFNYHMQTLIPEGRKYLEKSYPELFKNYHRIDRLTYAFNPYTEEDVNGIFDVKVKMARLTGRWIKQIEDVKSLEEEIYKYAEAVEKNCGGIANIYFSALDDNGNIRYQYNGTGSLQDKFKKAKENARGKQSAYTFRNLLYIIIEFSDTENEYFGTTMSEYKGNYQGIISNLQSDFLDIDRLIDSAKEATWSVINKNDAEDLKKEIVQHYNAIMSILYNRLAP